MFLLTYRATPNRQVENDKSPAEAMFGRKIRWNLELLRPKFKNASSNLQPKREFKPGAAVYYRKHDYNSETWVAATVVERIGKCLYLLKLPNGTIRAHINQLRERISNASDEYDEMMEYLDFIHVPKIHHAETSNAKEAEERNSVGNEVSTEAREEEVSTGTREEVEFVTPMSSPVPPEQESLQQVETAENIPDQVPERRYPGRNRHQTNRLNVNRNSKKSYQN